MFIGEFNLTLHAQEEIKRRAIPIKEVEKCLKKPQQIITSQDTRVVYQSKITLDTKSYLLRIIVETKTPIQKVITVYKTSKVEKYWEN